MFETLLREATLFIAYVHDALIRLDDRFSWSMDDKQMHFFVMLAVGMTLFFIVHFLFKRLAKVSVTAISFIYVFTVMTVLGFAVEVGQRITGTGSMDFSDIVAGLYGVLAFFGVYSVYRLLAMLCGFLLRKARSRK